MIFSFSDCLEPRSRRPTRHSAPAGFAAEAPDAGGGEWRAGAAEAAEAAGDVEFGTNKWLCFLENHWKDHYKWLIYGYN